MASSSAAKLMALCTLAVGAVYAAGYVYTEPQAQAASSVTSNSTAHQQVSRPTSSNAGSSSSASGSQSSSSSSPAAPAKAKYKDGTYTGSGSNPYGTLSAEVQIVGGRIASVRITSYTMHYPQSFIDPAMTKEFISMQTYRVYAVTGATASSYNYAEAVYYALQKAKV